MSITVEEFDFDIEYGFAWIKLNDKSHFQVCLQVRKGFFPHFNKADSGADWGLCGDANEKAINKHGLENLLNLMQNACLESGDISVNIALGKSLIK